MNIDKNRLQSLGRLMAMGAAADDALVTVKDIALLSSRGVISVRRDVKRGLLPKPIVLGPQTHRWRLGDVRAYLKGELNQ